MSMLVLLVFYAILFFVQRESVDIKVSDLMSNELHVVEMSTKSLHKEYDDIIRDLNYLREAYKDQLSSLDDYQEVASKWRVFSEEKMIYDQIRFISSDGMERVRINYNDAIATIVGSDKLQDKHDRYYFYRSLELKEKMIYVSQIDLNVESGEIEVPYKPVIRFATPIHDEFGNLLGVIVLNFLAENTLEEFRQYSESSYGELILLNSEGYWISSDDENNNWNFMFDNRMGKTFASAYSDEWGSIKLTRSQFETDNGIYTSNKLDLKTKKMGHSQFLKSRIIFGDACWYIVSTVNVDSVPEVKYVLNEYLLVFDVFKNIGYYSVLILLVSLLIGFLITINKKAYLNTKYYSEMDVMTQVYNRRAGLLKLENLQLCEESGLDVFSLCYIDVNGLKEVNDKLGHDCGDELLIKSLDIIKSQIRDEDFVVRLGGDEFLIVFVGVDETEAEKIWCRIKTSYDIINNEESNRYVIGISHGIVGVNRKQDCDIDALINIADVKMYTEKRVMKKNTKTVRIEW